MTAPAGTVKVLGVLVNQVHLCHRYLPSGERVDVAVTNLWSAVRELVGQDAASDVRPVLLQALLGADLANLQGEKTLADLTPRNPQQEYIILFGMPPKWSYVFSAENKENIVGEPGKLSVADGENSRKRASGSNKPDGEQTQFIGAMRRRVGVSHSVYYPQPAPSMPRGTGRLTDTSPVPLTPAPHDTAIASLRQELMGHINQQASDIHALKSSNAQLTSTNATLTSELTSLKAELTSSKAELTSSRHQFSSKVDQLTSLNHQLISKVDQLTSLNHQLTSLNHQLISKVDQLTSANAKLTSELTSLKAELTSSNHQFSSKIDQLTSSNHQLTSSNHQLSSKVDQLTSLNHQLISKVNQLTLLKNKLTSSNEELQSSDTRLKSLNADLSEKVHQLELSNADMVRSLRDHGKTLNALNRRIVLDDARYKLADEYRFTIDEVRPRRLGSDLRDIVNKIQSRLNVQDAKVLSPDALTMIFDSSDNSLRHLGNQAAHEAPLSSRVDSVLESTLPNAQRELLSSIYYFVHGREPDFNTV